MLVVLRVSLPDRPGALGQVASRIGSVRGDLLAIDILETGAGRAIDEFVVAVDEPRLVDLMINEVSAVDGVSVDGVRMIDDDRSAPEFVVLEAAAELTEADPSEAVAMLCRTMVKAIDAEWCVVGQGDATLERFGDVPDVVSDDLGSSGMADPGHVIGVRLPSVGLWVEVGRPGRRIHERERDRVALLARIADAVIPPVPR